MNYKWRHSYVTHFRDTAQGVSLPLAFPIACPGWFQSVRWYPALPTYYIGSKAICWHSPNAKGLHDTRDILRKKPLVGESCFVQDASAISKFLQFYIKPPTHKPHDDMGHHRFYRPFGFSCGPNKTRCIHVAMEATGLLLASCTLGKAVLLQTFL